MTGQRESPTFRKYHHHGSGFHGSPVDPRTKSDERSFARTGSSPERIRPRIAVGEIPRCVTRWRSTRDHIRDASGKSGVPSYRTMVAPSMSPPAMRHGPAVPPMADDHRLAPGS